MSDYYPQLESEEIYDVFLYGSVADQENGTPISVLTALARGNCDPWEEAARLARLSPDRAERELVELLTGGVGRKISFDELQTAAKRLVPLLPFRRKPIHAAAAASVGIDAARQLAYWVVWFAIITMLIVVQEHDRPAVVQSEGAWARNTERVASDAAKQDTGFRRSGRGLSRAEGSQNR
jgi:hypothetical protein